MMSDKNLLNSDWQKQANQYLAENNYQQVAAIYEQLIADEPNVKLHYWHLGLMLLLQGEELEAQTTWLLAMADGKDADIEIWTAELIEVLNAEAERQRLEVGNYERAWAIRQHIKEINSYNLDNLLHLVGLSTLRQTYTPQELDNLGLFDILKSGTDLQLTVDVELLMQVINGMTDLLPYDTSSYKLAEAFVPYIQDPKLFTECLVALVYKIAYSAKAYKLAIKFTELGLTVNPRHAELIYCLSSFYQDIREYAKGIETAKFYYSIMDGLAEKICANFLILRGLRNAGGHWNEFCSILNTHRSLIHDLIEQKPTNLDSCVSVRLFASTFFLPYFQDLPAENMKLRREVAKVVQLNVENYAKDTIEKCRHWQSHGLPTKSKKRLKIGYISHCLQSHSVGWLARWLFQYHNHDQFEIFAYLFAAQIQNDDLQSWYISKVDKAHKLNLNSLEVAEKVAEDEIDILVDLDSLTLTNTCETMTIKPAPLQVSWLGWDASGIPAVDYFIADPYVLPESASEYYGEQIWRLPQTYIAVDGFEVGVPTLRRDQLDIPNDAVIYFTAQRGYKYHPDTAKLQIQILKEVPNSYFLVKGLADRESLTTFYTEIMESLGVERGRIKFLPLAPSEAVHRANLAIADVVLDTYPYNGATTTMETLWMCIPMVTRVGEQFAARNSYTMMINAGITEGIAWTDEEYVEWGIRLGKDEKLRQEVSWKLRQSKQTAPLWNGQEFAREMENAYQKMWQRYIDSENCR